MPFYFLLAQHLIFSFPTFGRFHNLLQGRVLQISALDHLVRDRHILGVVLPVVNV